MFRLFKVTIMLALLPIPVAKSAVVEVAPAVVPAALAAGVNHAWDGMAPVGSGDGRPLQLAAKVKPPKCVPPGPPFKPPGPPPAVPPPKQSCTPRK